MDSTLLDFFSDLRYQEDINAAPNNATLKDATAALEQITNDSTIQRLLTELKPKTNDSKRKQILLSGTSKEPENFVESLIRDRPKL